MCEDNQATNMNIQQRYIGPATAGTEGDLGPLKLLPGAWISHNGGWNMIALPVDPNLIGGGTVAPFRILMNQYCEILRFTTVDADVPNRGINADGSDATQRVVTLDYEQEIAQIAVDDFPSTKGSDLIGKPCHKIHHETGLWLRMKNEKTKNLDIARLASIPHGNSVLALGQSDHYKGGAKKIPQLNVLIPPVTGMPIGRLPQKQQTDKYLAPYQHYIDNPFMGNVPGRPGPHFPGFSPEDMNEILRLSHGLGKNVECTTQLSVDSTNEQGGVLNIPFIKNQADATSMNSTFWIQEMKDKETSGDREGKPKLRLLYTQTVMLDFFPRQDGLPGRIRWPHISINSLEKISDDAAKELCLEEICKKAVKRAAMKRS